MKTMKISACAFALFSIIACNNDPKPAAGSAHHDTAVTAEAHTSAPAEEAPAPPDSATMAKAWENYMTPGEMHKKIAAYDGNWNAEVTSWMDPSAPPTKSTATAVNKMILGGRYQESRFKGNMMGMPFEGIGLMAYDNAAKKFVSTWVDNMGSGVLHVEGTMDESTNTLILDGDQTDPVSGKPMHWRETVKFIDKDNQLMEMFCTPAGGKEMKSMEIKLTRKK